MTDFAATRRAEAAHFTDRIGREVVVQHEAGIAEAFQTIDHLLGILGAERGGANRLGFAAGEQRRAVGARQEADDGFDRADLIELAAVDARTFLEDGGAHDVGFHLLHGLDRDHLGLRGFVREGRLGLGTRLVQRVRARRLVGELVGGSDIGANQFLELRLDVGGVVAEVDVPRILGGLLGQLDDRADHLADLVMREHHRAEHFGFGQFLGLGFDHHHSGVGRGDHEVEPAFGERLVLLRVERVFAVDVADARGANRAHEGHARDGERSRGRDHGNDVRLGLAVERQDLRDHVDLVVEAFGEQRTDRTVDQAAGERFLLGRAAFTLEEATGDTAGSRELFLIVDGEREEVLPFLHRLGRGHGAQHHGFAIGRQHGAIGLTGNTPGFQSEGLSAPLQRYGFRVEHWFSF